MSEKMAIGIDIDKALIEQNVTNLVASAIANALGDKEKIVDMAVSKIITSYVDESGAPCSRDKWRAKPYLQYLAEQCVISTVREQIKLYVEENKDQFAEEVKKQLSQKKFKESAAGAFISTILTSASSRYSMPITVSFEPDKD